MALQSRYGSVVTTHIHTHPEVEPLITSLETTAGVEISKTWTHHLSWPDSIWPPTHTSRKAVYHHTHSRQHVQHRVWESHVGAPQTSHTLIFPGLCLLVYSNKPTKQYYVCCSNLCVYVTQQEATVVCEWSLATRWDYQRKMTKGYLDSNTVLWAIMLDRYPLSHRLPYMHAAYNQQYDATFQIWFCLSSQLDRLRQDAKLQ